MRNIKALYRIIYKLYFILTPNQKKGAISVFFSVIICSFLELLGVSVIYPFLQLMVNEEAIRNKWYLKWIYSLFPDISYARVLVIICVGIIIVYLAKNAISLRCIYMQNRFSASFQRELSTEMLSSLMKRPYEYFVNTNSARVMQSVGGNVTSTYAVLTNLFTLFTECLTVFLIGCYLIYTDWVVAVASIALAFCCLLVIVLALKKRIKIAGKNMTEASISTSKACFHAIHGIKEISVMDRREYFVEAYKNAASEVERITLEYNFLSSCPDRVLEGVCLGGFMMIAGIRIISGVDIAEFLPKLGSFAIGAFKLLPSMSKISNRINSIVYEQNRLYMCYDDFEESRMYDIARNQNEVDNSDHNGEAKREFSDRIQVKNVTWKYEKATENVLDDLSVTVYKGEAVAFIGTSGAGKTTLADVLLGLLKPQIGSVYMDGIDIYTIPHEWAKIVGYVPQSVYLIDDTIKANVAFGIQEETVSDEKIWSALEEAQLAEFVRNLPEGINTIVGERGVKFSGGQRQRIAIARALYGNPSILVLDEATSALDTETETAVMESIESLLGKKTIIIIAHRLSTIRKCNKVYELVDGKAVKRDKSVILSSFDNMTYA